MSNYIFLDDTVAKCQTKDAKAFEKCLKRTVPQRPPLEAPGKVRVSSSPDFIQVGTSPGLGPCGDPKNCKTKLDFPTPAEVLKAGLPVGTLAVLQKCVARGKNNPMVPVASLTEALAVSKTFCGCVGEKKSGVVRKKCAKRAA